MPATGVNPGQTPGHPVSHHDPPRTVLGEHLGLRAPVCQAGMGRVARKELVAAMSGTGALRVIGAQGHGVDGLREATRYVRSVTDQPFGVRIVFGAVQVRAAPG